MALDKLKGQPVETVEVLAEMLREALERAKEYVARPHPGGTRTRVASGVEQIPEAKNTASIVHLPSDLPQLLSIPGMTNRKAMEVALTQLCGPEQFIDPSTVGEDTYIVDAFFMDRTPDGKGRRPIVMLSRVDRTARVFASFRALYEDVLQEPSRPRYEYEEGSRVVTKRDPVTGEKTGWGGLGHHADVALIHQQGRLKAQDEVRKDLTEIERALSDPQTSPFVVWVPGLSDFELMNGICYPKQPADDAKFHLMDVPHGPAQQTIAPENSPVATTRTKTGGRAAEAIGAAGAL